MREKIRELLLDIWYAIPFVWCSRCHRPHMFDNHSWRMINGKWMCDDEVYDERQNS